MSATAVIQAKQGIGDTIWHLPFIRAIAAASPGGRVTLLALPSTHAHELLAAEPCVERTVYFESRGSEIERGIHLARLTATLRRLRCETVWILDRTVRPAFAAWAAGIPNRIGFGLGRQRWFITNPGLDDHIRHADPLVWAEALMAAMNVPCRSAKPDLKLPPQSVAAVRERYGPHLRPWIVLALGASHPLKDWPQASWTEFIGKLRGRTAGTIFLIGGPGQTARAEEIIARTADTIMTVNACELKLIDAAALMGEADLFVGPDSGPLNIAAAVGTQAFGLFGATEVLARSDFIVPVWPDDGRGPMLDGMQRISPGRVLERIEPHLTVSGANAG